MTKPAYWGRRKRRLRRMTLLLSSIAVVAAIVGPVVYRATRPEVRRPGEELPETPGKLDLLRYDFLHPRNLLFGTPDYVAGKIEELQAELNLQHLQVWSNFPGVPHDAVMRSVKLFTEEVMPRFTATESGEQAAE